MLPCILDILNSTLLLGKRFREMRIKFIENPVVVDLHNFILPKLGYLLMRDILQNGHRKFKLILVPSHSLVIYQSLSSA